MLSEKKDLWKLVQKHISDEEPEMKKVAKSKKESEIIEKRLMKKLRHT